MRLTVRPFLWRVLASQQELLKSVLGYLDLEHKEIRPVFIETARSAYLQHVQFLVWGQLLASVLLANPPLAAVALRPSTKRCSRLEARRNPRLASPRDQAIWCSSAWSFWTPRSLPKLNSCVYRKLWKFRWKFSNPEARCELDSSSAGSFCCSCR